MIICIKMDLALNKLQRFICHKTQTTKPNLNFVVIFIKYYYETLPETL